ncbi:axial budding pattern protein 2, partial [Tremellales sp. Uapishka_1]
MVPAHFIALVAFSLCLSTLVSADPLIVQRPIAQQFPPVGRTDQPYSWALAGDTFSPPSDLTYTVLSLPPWLSFTQANRSFQGYPADEDVGLYRIQITATDTDGSSAIDYLPITVSEKTGMLNITDPLKDQLVANSSTITSAYPVAANSSLHPGVRVPPGWSFSLGFQPFTFTAPSKVFYQASLLDGSPLPAWLRFTNTTVTFDGVAPAVAAGIYQVQVLGSDVLGGADVRQAFNISVGKHELLLVSPLQVNLTAGYPLNTTLDIPGSFTLDDEALHKDQVGSIYIDTDQQSWLSYDTQNMSLSGMPPSSLIEGNNESTTELPITITDVYSNTVNTTLSLSFFPSVFVKGDEQPTIVSPGHAFNISLGRYYSNATQDAINLTASYEPQKAAQWIDVFQSNNTVQGVVPVDVDYDSVTVWLRAQDLETHAWSHKELIISLAPNGTTNVIHHHHHVSAGTIAALVAVGAIVGGLVLLGLFMLLCRRRRSGRAVQQLAEEGENDDQYTDKTPVMESSEKMEPGLSIDSEDPAVMSSLPQLSSGYSVGKPKKAFINPFARKTPKSPPVISNPIITPSLSNAAFQAQLAAAVDSAGIVKRGKSSYEEADDSTASDFTITESNMMGSSGRDDSRYEGSQSTRASWESEPPFVWTNHATPKEADFEPSTASQSEATHETSDSNVPVQRQDFRPSPPQPVVRHEIVLPRADVSEEGISIDNIHFPTDSDIAHTEASLDHEAVITTASRVDARRTLDSPASMGSPASSHTEKATPSPVMTTHSRLVSFGKKQTVQVNDGARSVSQTAVLGVSRSAATNYSSSSALSVHSNESTPPARLPPDSPLPLPPKVFVRQRSGTTTTVPSSLPSLPALPSVISTSSRSKTPTATAQRILLGVAEPFHFYPPLTGCSPSSSMSSTANSEASRPRAVPGAEYLAFVEKKGWAGRGERLESLPSWLNFEDMELWGVPGEEDRGCWDVRVVERNGGEEKVVGRFALEVSSVVAINLGFS